MPRCGIYLIRKRNDFEGRFMRQVLPIRNNSVVIVIGVIIFSLITLSFNQTYGCECVVEQNDAGELPGCCGSKEKPADPCCRENPEALFFDTGDATPVCCCITKRIHLMSNNALFLKKNQSSSYKKSPFAATACTATRSTFPVVNDRLTGFCPQKNPFISPHIATTILLL